MSIDYFYANTSFSSSSLDAIVSQDPMDWTIDRPAEYKDNEKLTAYEDSLYPISDPSKLF
jgi:hypothetical protein